MNAIMRVKLCKQMFPILTFFIVLQRVIDFIDPGGFEFISPEKVESLSKESSNGWRLGKNLTIKLKNWDLAIWKLQEIMTMKQLVKLKKIT